MIERLAKMLLKAGIKLWFFQLELSRRTLSDTRYLGADSNQNLDKFARFLTEPAFQFIGNSLLKRSVVQPIAAKHAHYADRLDFFVLTPSPQSCPTARSNPAATSRATAVPATPSAAKCASAGCENSGGMCVNGC
jgi:hypothetical protein